MINVEEIKIKILTFLEMKGPSLPIHVSRTIELSQVFTSAILSELVSAQKVTMSKLKVGASPLYLIPGQEQKLEKFANENLKGVEKTTYLKLKEENIIDDVLQEPAMRVALRSIKDFAVPIRFQDKLIWKYSFISNEEARDLLEKNPIKKSLAEEEEKSKYKIEEDKTSTHYQQVKSSNEVQENSLEKTSQKQPENIFEEKKSEPLKAKSKKTKVDPEKFLNEIKDYLKNKDIEFIRELEVTKKEVIVEIRINSDLGKISFILVAKDKKRPSLSDLTKAKKEATFEKMPCYFIARGNPASTVQDFLEEYKNIFKIDKF